MSKVINKRYEVVQVETIQPHPKNPNKGDKKAIGQSIEANKFFGACVCQESTRYILAGNHRYLSAVDKGAKSIPVFFVDVDDEAAVQILLADNRTRELNKDQTDEDVLLDTLEELSADGGLLGTGYVEATLKRLREEQAAPPRPEDKPVSTSEVKTAQFRAGSIKFNVDAKEAERWTAKIEREHAYKKKAVRQQIRKLIGIPND